MSGSVQCTATLVLIDESTRAAAPAARVGEWDEALRALAERNVFRGAFAGAESLIVGLDGEALHLELRDGAAGALCRARVPIAPLRKLIADYLLVINRIHDHQDGFGSPRLDTLDMAKRVYHDEAAEVVQRALASSLAPDLETARRIFTLLLVMVHDTSAAWIG